MAGAASPGAVCIYPTYSSWLNLVEVWFSILKSPSLADLSCTTIHQLRDALRCA